MANMQMKDAGLENKPSSMETGPNTRAIIYEHYDFKGHLLYTNQAVR
jgi:hypothetical protein